ncbi:MAG TPA: right-handed parallel beta-helix repeat-containing protein [Thermoplasmata archaeon]|nr:right-handed parallel beta-helix repeat-containing protein [Thermoplasmata archaeon]
MRYWAISMAWTLGTAIGAMLLLSAAGGAMGHGASDRPSIAGSFGVVTIAADGTISNPSAPLAKSGSDYQLTGPLNGSLVILASDVVVDGHGFLVNYTVGELGGDGAAVTVSNASGVTVEDFTSANATVGILANDTVDVTITDNSVVGGLYDIAVNNSTGAAVSKNDASGAPNVGIWIGQNSSFASVTGNTADDAMLGIGVQLASSVTISGNDLNDSWGDGVLIDTANEVTVSDNQMQNTSSGFGSALYAQYSAGLSILGNQGANTYGGFQVDYCRDVRMIDNNASATFEGLYAEHSQNVTIEENTAYDAAFGLGSEYSLNVSVTDNTLPSNDEPIYDAYDVQFTASGNDAPYTQSSGDGIYSYYSISSTFTDNNLSNSADTGAYLYESTGVQLLDNNLSGAADYGIYGEYLSGTSTFTGNDVSQPLGSSSADGIYLYASYGPVAIDGNDLRGQEYGVYVYYSYGPLTLGGNDLSNASYAGVYLDYSSASVTVANNTIDNASDYGIYCEYPEGGSTISITGNSIDFAGYAAVYDYVEGESSVGLVVSDNLARNASEYAVYAYYLYGLVSITGNNFSGAETYGVYLDDCEYGTTTVAGNDLSNVGDEAIESYSGNNVSVLDNTILNSGEYAIDLEYDGGVDTIVGNDLSGGADYGIYDYDSYGSVLVTDNNASGTAGYALDVELATAGPGAWIAGNNLSNSGGSYVYGCTLTEFAANALLNVTEVFFEANSVGAFYHNSIDSTAFVSIANAVEGGTWNADYPVGGNYWTAYAGSDLYSGPGQNVGGADGIGDSPYTIDGATDEYPLMTPWVAATVTFTESGLPAGLGWSVHLNGMGLSASAGETIPFVQTNGAYTHFAYTASSLDARYAPAPRSGSGVEDGIDQSIAIAFIPVDYTVNFTESGLAAGTSWSVTVDGVTAMSTGPTVAFNETNGTHDFTVAAVAGYVASPSASTISVEGGAVAVLVNFTSLHPTVVFIESGLPAGASWSVTLGGSTVPSTTTTVSFAVLPATYSFTISVPSGYAVKPASGSVVVTDGNVTVYVVAYSSAPGGPGSSSGTTVGSILTSPTGYALLLLLVIAIVAAIAGWVLYLRRQRPGAGATPAPWVPPAAMGPSGGPAAGGSPPSPPPSGDPGSPAPPTGAR